MPEQPSLQASAPTSTKHVRQEQHVAEHMQKTNISACFNARVLLLLHCGKAQQPSSCWAAAIDLPAR
jgi:hypothetical protein